MREDYAVDGEEGLTAVCTMRRRPWPTPIARRFSMAMAEEAGLAQKEGPWQTYPRRMLMMRARSWALRDGFADVLRGLSIREEVDMVSMSGATAGRSVRHARTSSKELSNLRDPAYTLAMRSDPYWFAECAAMESFSAVQRFG